MEKSILTGHIEAIAKDGFSIINDVFPNELVDTVIETIERTNQSNPNFRKTDGLFAIRQFLKEIQEVVPLIMGEGLQLLIENLFGDGYFIVKSIYFDKPDGSNWFVAYHQDLTISVDKKMDIEGFGRGQ
jgi:hypothetical protein